MKRTINVYDLESPIDVKDETYDSFSVSCSLPAVCPLCATALDPKVLSAYYIESKSMLYVISLCTKCDNCFLSVYYLPHDNFSSDKIRFMFTLPTPRKPTAFSEFISENFPQFVEIYGQSERAENERLDQICGLGYRKALEFLVKDYAIMRYPEEEEPIKKLPLTPCIEKYFNNSAILHLAKASAWLGNDATHYVKKHPEYNIQHLKAFILAIISYIDSEYQAMEAQRLLSADK